MNIKGQIHTNKARLIRLLACLVVTMLVIGCASMPPQPEFSLIESSRVGYLVETSHYPIHTHVGTTVFNNFSKSYEEEEWPLSELTEQQLAISLSMNGLVPVNLSELGYSLDDLDGLVLQTGGQWQLASGKEEFLSELKSTHQLAAVISVRPVGRHTVLLECGAMGCMSRMADGMGLFSRGMMGMLTFYAVPAVDLSVIVLEPLFNLAAYKPLSDYNTIDGSSVVVRNMPRPDEFREISPDELQPVRVSIETRLSEMMDQTARALMGQAQ